MKGLRFLTFGVFMIAAATFVQSTQVGNIGLDPAKPRSNISGGGKKGGGNPQPTTIYGGRVERVKVVIKTIEINPTTGTLTVSSRPNASLLIEKIDGGVAKATEIPSDENYFIFSKLEPGHYRVVAQLEGFGKKEKEVVIEQNKATGVSLNLEPIRYKINIDTNVNEGEVRYAPVRAINDPSRGTVYEQEGEVTSVVPLKDKRAVLSMERGTYGVDIIPYDKAYERFNGIITVPLANDEAIKVPLADKQSTTDFTGSAKDVWSLPRTWDFQAGRLIARGQGIALPANKSYLNYKDFVLSSDLRMLNDRGVSFVVRADAAKSNYYLIQLTGPRGDDPYKIKGYLVENGRPQLAVTQPINQISDIIGGKDFFEISIKATGKQIIVSVVSKGSENVILAWTDRDDKFPIGAVGLAVHDREEYEVGKFIVLCQGEKCETGGRK